VTRRGRVDLYVLVFMHLETREVFVTPATLSPDSAWVTEQAKALVNHIADRNKLQTSWWKRSLVRLVVNFGNQKRLFIGLFS